MVAIPLLCVECVLDWDQQGIDYRGMEIRAVTIIDGKVLCLPHFRLTVRDARPEATV